MSSTYTWPQVVNGKSYSEADFRPYSYATTLPDLLGNFAAQATNAQGAVKAAEAATSAAAAATSAAQAAGRVAGVTTGSTANLVYPEAIANLVTASDVRDVLVYDTRLDSDGGAWTRRCQHTSWWNETLNTATRGAKRDFPTVALIVLRAGSMTIYDLHDLDGSNVPRMWMVFTAGFGNHLFVSGGSLPTALAASNGYLVVTSTGGSGSGRAISVAFCADAGLIYSTFNVSRWSGLIVSRNSGANSSTTISAASIAGNDIADVDMRVLPGALRDGAGLPIPTIAVATGGGLSVIHPNGQVVSLTIASGHTCVSFVSDTHLGGVLSSDAAALPYYPIPYATAAEGGARVGAYYTSGQSLNYNIGGQSGVVADAAGGVAGLAQFAHELMTNPNNGMVALTAHTYATGWQPGDIRLAALCDAATGVIAASGEMITNGTFTTDTAGWIASLGTIAAVSNEMRVTNGGAYGSAYQTLTTVPGQAYTLTCTMRAGTAYGAIISVTEPIGNTLLAQQQTISASDVTVLMTFVAAGVQTRIVAQTNSITIGATAYFDSISVKTAVADRSHKARGLTVIGSLTRAAVGTGNDVVAVSGFTSGNYLDQPYNSLLDFGSGDFCISFWGRASTAGGYYLDRDSSTTGARISLVASGNKVTFAITDNVAVGASVTTSRDFVSTDLALWHFIRRGSVLEGWRNGVLDVSGSAGSVGSLTNALAVLRVGERVSSTSPAAGLIISMLRFSAYAPTPTQIARMWRDERALFDTGAKALLGGTTSAVQALSYSEHSQRLAVATTDGVGVFAGLRRVEYLSTSNLSPAMASNNASKIALEAGALVVGTAANAGMRRDAITGLDRMQATPRMPFSPRRLTARGFTTDATPLTLAPRLGIGERETLIVLATVVGRVFGAADGQRLSYQRRATYYRDAGGNVTLQGSVQTIGTDTEVTGTADATLVIDTTAQTVAPQVTGVAATRIVWTATLEVTRIADAQYEELV